MEGRQSDSERLNGVHPYVLRPAPDISARGTPTRFCHAGSIFESNAIARYVARIRRDTDLYGVSFFDSVSEATRGSESESGSAPTSMDRYLLNIIPSNPIL